MKNTIAAILLFVSLFSYSQSASWCGTVPPQDFLQTYQAKERTNYSAILSSRDAIKYVPIYYHIITQDDGTGGVNLKNVFDSHCELNEVYNAFGIGFFIKGIDTIKNSVLWSYQNDMASSTFNTYNKTNVCNVYVNGNLPGLCGFATFPFSGRKGGGIFMNKACIGATTTTYPHEMGHYLGLLHTFDDTFGKELVNGSNCRQAGDLFCDTPADFIDFRTACPYLGDEADANGDLYRDVIDETLFMSYFNDNCVDKFSDMQKAEMMETLNNQRAALLNQPLPDVEPLGLVDFISPLDGDNFVNSLNANFLWHQVPNTAYYYFHLQSATSSVVFADVITTDTFFVATNLQVNKKYKYIVKAISLGNTCGTEPAYQVIQTSNMKLAVTVTRPVCNDVSNGAVTVQASGGSAPYTYEWADGTTDQTLLDIAGGDYPVTVTDKNGNIVVSIVHVDAPAPVTVQFNTVDGKLSAVASGGTSPYNYIWSNGVTTQINNNAKYGNYSVTVVDVQGCSTNRDIAFTTIGAEPEMKVAMKIFPNPANGATVTVQFELGERMEALVLLMDINGKVVQQYTKDLPPGSSNLRFNTSHLSPGMYMLRCQSRDAVITQKFSVVH